jgi:hypothetical protein
LVLYEPIGFWRRLETMHRLDAELPLKEIRQSGSLKLLGCRAGRVIREGERSNPASRNRRRAAGISG